MTKRTYISHVEKQIRRINDKIDGLILAEKPYGKEAQEHIRLRTILFDLTK